MSDKDPKAKKIAGQPSANPPSQPQGAGSKPGVPTKTARKGANPVLVLAFVLTVAGGGAAWYWMNQRTSPPVASASPEVEEHFAVESEPAEDTLAEAAPGAEAAAEPETEPATPADTPATGTLEVESGKRDIKIDLVSPVATLNEAVAVKHKHRIGSCDGVLRASAAKLEYDSPHKDAFSVALSEVERFSLEKENLSVKVRDGRSYNFNERNDNHTALASFHERVAPSLEKEN